MVKCLLPEGETWRIVENHFALPVSVYAEFRTCSLVQCLSKSRGSQDKVSDVI